MTIRTHGTAADRPQIAAILNRSGFFNEEEVALGVSLLDEYLEKGVASEYYFLFAEEGQEIIGYSCYGPIPGTLFSWDLYWIAVDPDHQRQGCGQLILKKTEELVAGFGGRRIYVETSSRPLYEPTRRFYERAGYREEARLAQYYAPDDDKVLYVKWWD